MKKTYNHYIDGKIVATYPQNKNKQTLEQRIERAKRAQRDARLVNFY